MASEQNKPHGYYSHARSDLVSMLPRPLGRVLDVGCGEGEVGRGLRAAGATLLVGVEPYAPAAERASAIYDKVFTGPVEGHLPSLGGPFDTICCYDVLEHLADPYAVLRGLADLAAPGAHLHVSVPNARHFSLLLDLAVRGTFGYADEGHRDRTHLRWFTLDDITTAINENNWRSLETAHPRLGRSRVLDRLTRGRSTQFLVGQWYVLARLA